MKKAALAIRQDWTPRSLPGGIYCSPACGGVKGFCKRSDYERAVKDSDALAARMGDGWKPEVWENLGWHWRIAKGPFELHRQRDGSFSAWFQISGITQIIVEAETPEDAIGFATQDARTLIRRIENGLADASHDGPSTKD